MKWIAACFGILAMLIGCKQPTTASPDATMQSSRGEPQLGCTKDTDCKNDRICEKNTCVALIPPPIVAAPGVIKKTPVMSMANSAALDVNRQFEPGVNFGAVTDHTNEKSLIELYGKKNVKRDAWHLGEGQYRAASVVLKGTKDEFWVLWKDDKYLIAECVIVIGSAWSTSEGLRVGLPLDSLIKINGRNFLFYGFEWDYGGAVESWAKGRLSRFGDGLTVFLTRDFNVTADAATEEAVVGDQSVLSSTPGLGPLKIKVYRIEADL
jgi:hypothetical protein